MIRVSISCVPAFRLTLASLPILGIALPASGCPQGPVTPDPGDSDLRGRTSATLYGSFEAYNINKHLKYIPLRAAKAEQEIIRPLTKYPPSISGFAFADLCAKDLELESYAKEADVLKERVKDMLMQSTQELTQNVEFINLLCRLGLSYHFENDIEEQLNHIFTSLPNFFIGNDYDLHTAALIFRVLRQYGYKVPCDVFNKFKDNNGEFKRTITNDAKGLLSLYDASFLSVHGEDILDEALKFTKQHLEILAAQSSPHLAKQIRNALQGPIHHGMQRLETMKYISLYQEDESRNETLLEYAKLDYNRVQLLYRQELASLLRWWEELNLTEKLPFARDRIVEVYVWTLGCLSEPQWGRCRVLIAKYTQMEMTTDDAYDEYGTIDELQRFTDAFQRCSIDAIDHLPEYLKHLYKAILKLFEETENNGNIEGSSYKTSFAKEMFKEVTRSYMLESQWLSDGFIPTFDEYLRNGSITITGDLLASAFFLELKDAGIKDMVWLRENPGIVKVSKLFARLCDDITSHEGEKKADAVECYMNEFGVSREKAIEEITKMIENIWKDVNEEYMKPSDRVSRTVLNYFLNFVRVSELVFIVGRDAYTYSTNVEDCVTALLLDQFPLRKLLMEEISQ
ncbi:probable terpene synthase 8 [Jatropha curcas]|uniref:probable terpene synthase 8 n=1 Tax=Jatropha curcas TaxID=180498 RepID=UPI001893982F|nr:probable terpene synthase 8 [Jatropha curcas]